MGKDKRLLVLLDTLLFISLLGAIAVYFTPYLTVYNMTKAAEKKDAEALSQYVDYPSVRESLKANLNAMMAKEMVNSGNPFAALGVVLGSALVNQMVDAFLTPESMAMLMKGERPQIGGFGKGEVSQPPATARVKTTMSYEGLNLFVVKVKEKGSSQEGIRLIYKRDGIISWRLSALRLPQFSGDSIVSKSNKVNIIDNETVSKKLDTALLVPTLINKRFQETDWEHRIYQEAIWFDVVLDTSRLKKPTRAIKGTLIMGDIFGEPKFRLQWTINKPLTPGVSYTETGVGFDYNQYLDGHQWVRATDFKDMTFRFEESDIIYQDKPAEQLEKSKEISMEVPAPVSPAQDIIGSSEYKAYYNELRREIREATYKRYTKAESGEVAVALVVSLDGILKSVSIDMEKTKASSWLMQSVLAAVQDIGAFPPFPDIMKEGGDRTFNVTISFAFKEGE